MPRLILIAVLLAAATDARAQEEDPLAFLAEAQAAQLDLTALGLKSYTARCELRRSADANLARFKEHAGFGYSWAAPETEEFDFSSTHETLHKGLRDALRGIWRDINGTLWFDVMAKTENLALERGDPFTVLVGELAEVGEVRVTFETRSLTLVEAEFVKLKAKISYFHEPVDGGRRVTSHEVTYQGKWVFRISYGSFKKVSGFKLPTVLGIDSEANTTEYFVAYQSVNGRLAETEAADDDAVKDLVKAFEKTWRGRNDAQKIEDMRTLAETPHDLVSAAIAKQGLRDRSVEVRKHAAEILGVMKRQNVVPAMIGSMKKNVEEIEVYLLLIRSLGEIGDPRAVDILSKDWWNQRIGEYAVAAAKEKIRALGNIPHVSSVDALIDSFYVAKEETIGWVKADLILSLMKLTGQDFKYDRRAWKDWWKRNRSTHEFE